jgi:predicted nucleic acid-binding protein
VIDLDANFLVDVFRGDSSSARLLSGWMKHGQLISISSIAWAEFLCGPVEASNAIEARGLIGVIEPFTDADAALAAELFNRTGRRSRSHVDCMIAAHAIRRNTKLATLNLRDFQRFKAFGLNLV